MNTSQTELYRALPAVSRVLAVEALQTTIAQHGEAPVKQVVREHLATLRGRLEQGGEAGEEATRWLQSADFLAEFCSGIKQQLAASGDSGLRPVFNLTGTIIHTNLGRSRLPDTALAALNRIAGQACDLEFDLEAGERGDRDQHLESLVCELTGAEAATVVNNNAAAVLLVANTLAFDKEIIVSRGELVEIGGSFRIPDVMRTARCKLHEVGTTNRTHLKDYRDALGKNTGAIMKVHTSNYAIKGFTSAVSEAELARLAGERGVPFVADLGSGTLLDLRKFGLPHEPTVTEILEAGADVVTFSGDKLLGGPQAGLIAGRCALIEAIRKNPLKRALRVDKLTIAALSEVLKLYRDPANAVQQIPFLADLTRPEAEIEALAVRLQPILAERIKSVANVAVGACQSQIGSGALPLDLIPSHSLSLTPIAEKGDRDASLQSLALAFRRLPWPVIGRIHDGRLIFDLRCLRDEKGFVAQLESLSLP